MKHCILIVDDEQPALDYLAEVLQPLLLQDSLFSQWDILRARNAEEAKNIYREKRPMLLFLDINMPGTTGLELAKEIRDTSMFRGNKDSLKKQQSIGSILNSHSINLIPLVHAQDQARRLPAIVFFTAHEEYGADAFQVHAIDYIMKPASEQRIAEALRKFKSFYQHELLEEESFINCYHGGIEKKIAFRDIYYFRAEQKYTVVKTAKHEFLITLSLLKLEERFPHMIKIHRSYLINPAFIDRFFRQEQHWMLKIKDSGEQLPVSRRQRQELQGKLFFDKEED